MPAAPRGHPFPETSSVPSTPSDAAAAARPGPSRSGCADTFARLRDELPLQSHAVVDASAGDQMHVRSLLIAITRCRRRALRRRRRRRGRGPGAGCGRCRSSSRSAPQPTAASSSPRPARPPARPLHAPPATPPAVSRPGRDTARRPSPPPRREPRAASPRLPRPRRPSRPRRPRRRSSVTVEPQAIEPGDGIAQPKVKGEKKTTRRSDRRRRRPRRTQPQGRRTSPPRTTRRPHRPSTTRRSCSRPPSPPRSVPNILLDRFEIPPFLLPLYQAAGVQYGVRWEILAAINSIETDYGRNLSVSSAGALGWMQFMPATWEMYGVDANGDGVKDPYNPVDAIFAAARYLKAAGAGESLRRAIWAYNHADWYVNDVIGRAQAISALPDEVVASLSGLTLGRFPVAAHATYAGRISTKSARAAGPNASVAVEGDGNRRGMRIYTRAGSAVVAVQDGVVVGIGETEAPGQVRAPARRLRQPLRLRAPGERRRDAPGPAQAHHVLAGDPPRAGPRRASDKQPARAATAGRRGSAKRVVAEPATTPLGAIAARLDRPTAATIASVSEGPAGPRRRHLLRGMVRPALHARPRGRRAQAAHEGLTRHRRHDPRPRRPRLDQARGRGPHGGPPRRAHDRRRRGRRRAHRTCGSRSAPPAARRRASTPSRSSTAGAC